MIWRLLDAALLLAGAGAIVWGTTYWSPGAAWVVAGAACIGFGLLPPRSA